MPLIKDLIHIPEQVNRGDFVLNLVDGVQHPQATAESYVVTDQLAKAFTEALTFLKSVYASPGGKSKATYLHGSFGSGKSHFMAILSLLLEGHEVVRNLPKLQPVIQSQDWTSGKRFLLVPLHMLNKESMEQGILGGYADFIRRKHPEAPLPAFFKSSEILVNADALRASMGDEAFFARLNAGSGESSGGARWGTLEVTWTPQTYAAAKAQDHLGEDRRHLISDIVQHLITVLRNQGDYVSLDEGLVAMSHHAKALGYHGVILFLDELVLWLMSRAADPHFVGQEGPKLAALVEGRIAHATIPIVSFVARQKDLREALGENMTGASHQAISNTMTWWEERFHTIVLEDRNLPVIAQERLLKPLSGDAKKQIDEAFTRTAASRQEVMEALLTTGGTADQFRNLYPFSPALVQVLVAVSGALQRERTALRILLQILCQHRDRLELGQVVPVGDLWDVVAAGEEVFAPQMRKVMEDAKRLWSDTLRPLILADAGLPVDFDPATADASLKPSVAAYIMRARVAKTLLLTAIVPGVESLKNLKAGRLAALNHGVITSPIPRQEARTVLKWLKDWQPHCGQIKLVGDPNDPIISLELSDVDTDAIIRQARGEDNDGNRKRLIMQLLFTEMNVSTDLRIVQMHNIEWRGSMREVEIRYLNVREANLEHLKAGADKWVVIIDYPFDEHGKSPADDKAVLADFQKRVPKGSKTLVWLPNFLSQQSLTELGNLVIINYLLSGTRLDGFTGHLNTVERQEAKKQLETRKSALERRVLNALEVAYGVSTAMTGAVDRYFSGPGDQTISLENGFIPQPTERTTLAETLIALVHQALEYQFPLHPRFTTAIKKAHLKRIAEYVTDAMTNPQHRTERVDRSHREIMTGIAEPLLLGTPNENVFHFKREWVDHFTRCMAQDGTRQPTVSQLREWCDKPQARGLPNEVADLVIWIYAQQADRRFYHHNVAVNVGFEQLDSAMDLREQALPDERVWALAQDRAGHAFGYPSAKQRNSATVGQLVAAIRQWERERKQPAADLVVALTAMAKHLAVEPAFPRLATAKMASDWLNAIGRASDETVVGVFASTPLPKDLPTVAKSIETAAGVTGVIKIETWGRLMSLTAMPSSVQARALSVLTLLREHLSRDQRDADLVPTVNTVSAEVPLLWARADQDVKPTVDPDEERRRKEAEEERQRLERERQEVLRREREVAEREAQLRREEAQRRAEEERRRNEEAERRRQQPHQPVEIEAARSESVLGEVKERIAHLAKANPTKRIRITIEIVDPG
jgi:hypothetical protein